MKCHNCGHEWEYKGSYWYATCPSCHSKVKTPFHGTVNNKRKVKQP